MTFIEGIGDEVTAFFVVLIVIILATLVTFIGSGPHSYSPVHTRTLQISVISGRELAEESSIVFPPAEVRAAYANHRAQLNNQSSNNEQAPPHNEQASLHNEQASLHNEQVSRHIEEQTSPNDQSQQETDTSSDQQPLLHEPEETGHQSEEDQNGETIEQENVAEVEESPVPSAPAEETVEDSAAQGMRVRLKYLDDTERTVRSTPLTKVAEFKRVHFSTELSSHKVVRLIFCGHLLRDSYTLAHYRVKDNSVVHVQVLSQSQSPQSSPQSQHPSQGGEMPDLSPLLWPLVTLTLGLLWGAYIKYPHLFSALSLSCLFIFTAGLFAFYRHNRA